MQIKLQKDDCIKSRTMLTSFFVKRTYGNGEKFQTHNKPFLVFC